MCGINGFNFRDQSLAFKMKKFTKSRGPDADGEYCNPALIWSLINLQLFLRKFKL